MKISAFIHFAVVISFGVNSNPISLKSAYKFAFYTRADWGALPPNGTGALDVPVLYVVIHHTYIPAACYSTEACSESMRSMQNYHNSLDWGDIGYNFCIGAEGGAYEGRGWSTLGIHAGKANKYSIGICLIGDFRVNLPPQVQLDTTKALINAGVKLGYIQPDFKLIGHNQVMATECPGAALFEEISKWEHFSSNGFELSTDKTKH